MAGKDKRTTRRAPVVLRIKLRYADIDTFVDRFATNVGTGGMFIASRKPKPRGTRLKFSLMLADESSVVAGTGVVRWVRPYDPEQPRRPHGMGIEFATLEEGSQDIIDRVVAHRASRGLETDEIPLADKSAVPQPSADEFSGPIAVETGPVTPVPAAPRPATSATPAPPAIDAGANRRPAPAIPQPGPPPSYADTALDELLAGPVDLAGAFERARALAKETADDDLGQLLADLPRSARTAAPAPMPAGAGAAVDNGDDDAPTALGNPFPSESGDDLDAPTALGGAVPDDADDDLDAPTALGGAFPDDADDDLDAPTALGGAFPDGANDDLDAPTALGGAFPDGANDDLDAPTALGGAFPGDANDDGVGDFDDVPTSADASALPLTGIEPPANGSATPDAPGPDHPLPGLDTTSAASTFDIDTSDLVELDTSDFDEVPPDPTPLTPKNDH